MNKTGYADESTKVAPPTDAVALLDKLRKLKTMSDDNNAAANTVRDILFGSSPSTCDEKSDCESGGGLLEHLTILVDAIIEKTSSTTSTLENMINRCNH